MKRTKLMLSENYLAIPMNTKPYPIKLAMETLIEQLEYAVKKANGLTTITNNDLEVMKKTLKWLPQD